MKASVIILAALAIVGFASPTLQANNFCSTNAQCPSGQECYNPDDNGGTCVNSPDLLRRQDNNFCSTNAQCPSGQECYNPDDNGGVCVSP
jgi:Cys-rich repeat protein